MFEAIEIFILIYGSTLIFSYLFLATLSFININRYNSF